MVRQRVRIRFSKSDNLKYIGHKDLLRTFESLFRRARLSLAMSGGYHPKVRMSFPSALALGVEGYDEVLDLELTESTTTFDSTTFLADLNRCSVDGLDFLSARLLDDSEKKAKLVSSRYEMTLPDSLREEVERRIRDLLASDSVVVVKTNGKPVDVRSALSHLDFSCDSGLLSFELFAQEGPEAGFREVLAALELDGRLFKTVFPKRVRCRLSEETEETAPRNRR